MKRIVLIPSLLLAFAFQVNAAKTYTKQEYVEMWNRTAMEDMMVYKIPASITLAQGILESGNGNSDLARLANNHFGIKCHNWTGEKMYKDDDQKNDCFRKYAAAELSFKDHSEFLTNSKRYAALFTLDIADYKSWAKGLKAAGYATNPKYPTLLIDIIEDLQLYKFDELALNNPRKKFNALEKQVVKNTPETHEKATSHASKKKVVQSKPVKQQEVEVVFGGTRQTFLHTNKVKYIVAQKGDTYYKLAQEFCMTLSQIENYNDVKNGNTSIKEGDIINIHPKLSKSKEEFKTYNGDYTILQISQLEGVKVKSLMKINGLTSPKDIVKSGQKVALR
ncbi:MAG: glucosaminidase domain-containing protein [Crocinitomicaceae bacterium]|nr:glucosaminidase domain-containing protein [Crocinitomicaceae bacterium]